MSALRQWLEAAAAAAARGRTDRAIAAYREAIALAPAQSEYHYNLGVLLASAGDDGGAEQAFEEAQRLRPAWAAAPLALGRICHRQLRYADARRHFERAVALAPESAQALGNLALTLNAQKRNDLALPYLRRARRAAPADEDIWFTLRANLLQSGLDQEATDDFLQFERAAKPSPRLVVTGVIEAILLGDDGRLAKYLPLAVDAPYAPSDAHLVATLIARLQYVDVSRETLASVYRTYNRLQQANLGGVGPLAAPPRRNARVLRVGYLSADFRNHVMGHVMTEILAHQARGQFSPHAYSLAPPENEDATTERIASAVDGFVRLAGMDDVAAAQRIAADRLDVLVDLMAHTALARPAILLYKPAPVIVTHLGFHGCVGLEQVDYKLTDRHADPPDAAHFQIEAPLRMDTCVMPVRRVAATGVAPTRAQLGIARDTVVFGAFVGVVKLSSRCVGLWREILERVAVSKLALAPYGDAEKAMLLRRLARGGIAADRVLFLPYTRDEAKDRARYALVDVVLDTLPYSGGDTTVAALDMGVPVVSRCGSRHAERMTFSILAHLGVTATVAGSDAEYVSIACRLATDAAWRGQVAATIRERLATTALADPAHYTRCLERALRHAAHEKASASGEPKDATLAPSRFAEGASNASFHALPDAACAPVRRIGIVTATRLPEREFWSRSALGASLRRLESDRRLVARPAFANRRGIPEIYNAAIAAGDGDDVLVFVHDDVSIADDDVADRIAEGLAHYDVIGVAGNRRRRDRQPAWSFPDTSLAWDKRGVLSGSIAHGACWPGRISWFGPAPAECELLDGVFLAARRTVLLASGVAFDPVFDFHFYDMDFCRTARQRGLRLGTWPLRLAHESAGAFGTEPWKEKYRAYLDKWRA